MQFHRVLLGNHLDAGTLPVQRPQLPRTIVSGHPHAGFLGALVGIEEHLHQRPLATRRHGEERTHRAAVPEPQQVVTVADEQDGFLGDHPGIVELGSGERDAAFAGGAPHVSFVILIAGAHAGREAPLGVRNQQPAGLHERHDGALHRRGGSRGVAVDHRLEVGERSRR